MEERNIIMTFDSICESQLFEHGQKFVIFEDYLNKIKELEAHFKLKQDDWIEACKEIDKLEAKLAEAEKDQSWLLVEYKGTAQLKVDVGSLKNKLKVAVEALEKVEHLLPLPVDGDDENEPVVIIREALRKIGEGV